MKTIVLLPIFAVTLLAADEKQAPKTDPVPTLSPDQLRAFWKAKDAVDIAQGSYQSVVSALATVCGQKYQLQLDQATGEPACAVKQPVPAPPSVGKPEAKDDSKKK